MKILNLFAAVGFCGGLAGSPAHAFDGLGRMDRLGRGDDLGFNHFGEPRDVREPRGFRPHMLPRSERQLRHPLRPLRADEARLYGWGYGEGFGHHGL